MNRKAPVKPEFEAVYLVDRGIYIYIYLRAENSDYVYQVFSLEGKQLFDGTVTAESSDKALWKVIKKYPQLCTGLDIAEVGLTTLKNFRESEIYVRAMWEPDTLPKDDIRFIDPQYNNLFWIPNGGKIVVDRALHHDECTCRYIDEYHTYINGRCFHICQWAENLERNGSTCKPAALDI